MEERLKELETRLDQKIKEYDLALSRADAVLQVNNLMGRYAFYYQAQEYIKCAELWARREDSVVDVGLGHYVGYDAIKYAYSREGKGHGLFRIHMMCTPVIEIAADGQTARAVYFSPGVDTNAMFGKPSAAWCYIKYGVDFIYENGIWYLWRLMAYGLFHTDFYQSWADKEKQSLEFRSFAPPGIENTEGYIAPRKFDRHDWHYSADRLPELDPCPPEPYENWDSIGDAIACHSPCEDPEREIPRLEKPPMPPPDFDKGPAGQEK